ncbi:MAG TPA: oligopeptide transporter, OPT family [Candidatus Binatia bacterium]|nr:oligopeptide transporter, OPT family [Candidatus Binatia bacterium]
MTPSGPRAGGARAVAGEATAEGAAQPLVPYVAADAEIPELTLRAVLLGATLSVLFGMVNAYVGLRVGLTVSASIPSAVISMAVLRGLLRRGTILENNVVHAIGSAGDSLAAGVVFTVPALLFLGLSPTGFTVFLLGITAGWLGIVAMMPMRRDLTIAEHGRLPFPEGTACAEVLVAGDRGGASARPVVRGVAVGALYALGSQVLGLWRERVSFTFASLHKATIGFDLTPLFLGAGYLVGARIAAVMASGGVLAWCVLVPLADAIAGTSLGDALGIPAGTAALDAAAIWRAHVRYVGAGAVAMGGAVSLASVLPAIAQGAGEGWRVVRATLARRRASERPASEPAARDRNDRDLPAWVPPAGVAACGLALWLVPSFGLGPLEALFAIAFSIFFAIVSARIVGLVGTTSQPVSGMTITAILATSFVLKLLGHTGREAMAASITVGAVVAISSALAGDLAQDLKTAALVGATPARVQIAQLIGTFAAAVRAGWVLLLLHQAYGLGSELLPAPQSRLMATLVEGVAQGQLPWALMAVGAGLALAAALAGVPALAFAIGLYLPITTTAPILLGGLVRAAMDRARRAGLGAGSTAGAGATGADASRDEPDDARAPTLIASGMIAGEALAGIAVAALVVVAGEGALHVRGAGALGDLEAPLTIAVYALLVAALARGDGRRGRA